MKFKYTILLLALLTSNSCVVQYTEYLGKQGGFVETPLIVGATIAAPTVILSPLTMPLYYGEAEQKAGAIDFGFVFYPPMVIGNIVATPFLALKKTFYDFPVYLITDHEAIAAEKERLRKQRSEKRKRENKKYFEEKRQQDLKKQQEAKLLNQESEK